MIKLGRERWLIRVTGTVQGVGFRPFVYRHAVDLGLTGYVGNDSEGVVIEVQGPPERLEELGRRLLDQAPPLARIATVDVTPLPADGVDHDDFGIIDSRGEGAGRGRERGRGNL